MVYVHFALSQIGFVFRIWLSVVRLPGQIGFVLRISPSRYQPPLNRRCTQRGLTSFGRNQNYLSLSRKGRKEDKKIISLSLGDLCVPFDSAQGRLCERRKLLVSYD